MDFLKYSGRFISHLRPSGAEVGVFSLKLFEGFMINQRESQILLQPLIGVKQKAQLNFIP